VELRDLTTLRTVSLVFQDLKLKCD